MTDSALMLRRENAAPIHPMSTSAMLGTRFPTPPPPPEDDVDLLPARPKKPWEKEVRDEEGRRRFHGAFTGGFSAGYVQGGAASREASWTCVAGWPLLCLHLPVCMPYDHCTLHLCCAW